MRLLNTNQIKSLTNEERAEYNMSLLFNIEDSILGQVFEDDSYLYDEISTEADYN